MNHTPAPPPGYNDLLARYQDLLGRHMELTFQRDELRECLRLQTDKAGKLHLQLADMLKLITAVEAHRDDLLGRLSALRADIAGAGETNRNL